MNKPPYRVPLMSEIAAFQKNGFKVISTFSGCGGSSLGYKMAGFDVVMANEFIPAAQETYRANHPTTILECRDIRKVTAEEILAASGLKVGELDLFDGSPPCSSFSTAGIREKGWGKTKAYSDLKGGQRTDDLFFEYARLVKDLQPKVFVAENVKGLTIGVAKEVLGSPQLNMFGGEKFTNKEGEETISKKDSETILHTLMDCGYKVGLRVLNAADLGVPQSRNRAIFVGVRNDLVKKFDVEPCWPSALGYVYTIRDAIPWITKAVHDTSGLFSQGDVTNKPCPAITVGINSLNSCHYKVEAESDISRYATGAEWDKLQVGEQSEKYFSLIKTDPELPCPTICASHGSGGIASTTHPFEKRKFSIAELRRICGFPDDFILTGSYQQQWERLGRAVPPVMMSHIAACVRDKILNKIRDAEAAEKLQQPLI